MYKDINIYIFILLRFLVKNAISLIFRRFSVAKSSKGRVRVMERIKTADEFEAEKTWLQEKQKAENTST